LWNEPSHGRQISAISGNCFWIIGRKIGETEYLLSLIPLGGYVKLLGETPGEELSPEEEKRSFQKQTVLKRIGIVAAGPVFNLLLAVAIFTTVNMVGLPVLTSEIGALQPASAAMESGMKVGDRIIALDGRSVSKWDEISEIIARSEGRPLRVILSRDGRSVEISVTPRLMKSKNVFGEEVETYKIGISPSPRTVIERHYPLSAFGKGVQQTWMIGKLTLIKGFSLGFSNQFQGVCMIFEIDIIPCFRCFSVV